jgi:hypothetical protein
MNDCRLLGEKSAECAGVGAGAGCLWVFANKASGYWVGGFGEFEWDGVGAQSGLRSVPE